MKNIYIAITDNNQKAKSWLHKTLHAVKIPDVGDQGFYREITSLNAFDSNTGRNLYNRKSTLAVNMVREDEFDESSLFSQHMKESYTWYAHESIWEFYEFINYDRKKRKILV